MSASSGVGILPVNGIPEVEEGDDISALIRAGLHANHTELTSGDVVVVASKIVSKAEGRLSIADPPPGNEALRLAATTGFEPGEVQLILDQSSAVLRAARGVLVVETDQGFVCANAGIDRSNVGVPDAALLLPLDPDASADRIRQGLEQVFGVKVAVLVSDTFGRPFRLGLVNVALGVSGMKAIRDYRGQADPAGRQLKGTEIAVVDELCSAAELVMNKLDRVPVALIRGYRWKTAAGSGQELLRDPALDTFR